MRQKLVFLCGFHVHATLLLNGMCRVIFLMIVIAEEVGEGGGHSRERLWIRQGLPLVLPEDES